MPKPFRVAAAIDFGTHGTGFAWAAVSQDNSEPHNRRISLFEDWPDQSIASPKNRSAVLLDSGGQFLAWGDQAIAQMEAMPPGAGSEAADRLQDVPAAGSAERYPPGR